MLPAVYEAMKKRREKGGRSYLFYSIVQGYRRLKLKKGVVDRWEYRSARKKKQEQKMDGTRST